MKRPYMMLPLFLGLCLFTSNALAAATLHGNALTYDKTAFTLEAYRTGNVDGSDMRFAVLDEESAATIGKKPVILFFAKDGSLLHEFSPPSSYQEGFGAEQCFAASLSPKGDILALDNGTFVIRSWHFFAFPSFVPLGKDVQYLEKEEKRPLVWPDNATVMLTTFRELEGNPRQCGYDPCGSSSVSLFSVTGGTLTHVLEGTDLCDYTLLSFDGKMVTASRQCAQKAEDWANTSDKGKFTISKETVAVSGK